MAEEIQTKNILTVDDATSVDASDKVFVNDDNSLRQATVSQIVKAGGAITSETDPTVPAWAKQPTKPTYTAAEVGALPDTVTALPNPHKLIFTGAVNAEYDGSQQETIEIPQGSGGGTTEYGDLQNKPQINGVTLEGNKTLDQIGAVSKNQGTDNTGKYLSVDDQGNVICSDVSTGIGVYYDAEQEAIVFSGESNSNNEEVLTSASGTTLTLADCSAKSPTIFTSDGETTLGENENGGYPNAEYQGKVKYYLNDSMFAEIDILRSLFETNGSITYKDRFDAVNKKVTKNIHVIVFTGDEDFSEVTTYNPPEYTIPDSRFYAKTIGNYDSKCGAVSSIYSLGPYGSMTNNVKAYYNRFGISGDGSKIRISYSSDNETIASTSELKNFLKQKYEEGNPFIVMYILKDPYEEDVNMSDLILAEGNNNITNDKNYNMDISYYRTVEYSTNSEYLSLNGLPDPESNWWDNYKNLMGFNKNNDPIPQVVNKPVYGGMYTAYSSYGRWHSGKTITSTSGIESESTFVDGGHVFEGWDVSQTWRLTALIGKFTDGRAHIFTFKPASSGVETFGIVTIGGDHEYDGVDFARKYMQAWGSVIAQNGFTGTSNYGSQKYYGGISGVDKTKPDGAYMEITATQNTIPNQIRFMNCSGGLQLPCLNNDPLNLSDGLVWYNTVDKKYKCVIDGEIHNFVVE